MASVDLDTFMEFVHKFAGDLGAPVAAGAEAVRRLAELGTLARPEEAGRRPR